MLLGSRFLLGDVLKIPGGISLVLVAIEMPSAHLHDRSRQSLRLKPKLTTLLAVGSEVNLAWNSKRKTGARCDSEGRGPRAGADGFAVLIGRAGTACRAPTAAFSRVSNAGLAEEFVGAEDKA